MKCIKLCNTMLCLINRTGYLFYYSLDFAVPNAVINCVNLKHLAL